MTEAHVQPVLASTTVSEDARDLIQDVRKFYERNHVCITVTTVLFFSVLLNRSVFRRELKRLRFAVELIAEDEGVDYFDRLVAEANSPD